MKWVVFFSLFSISLSGGDLLYIQHTTVQSEGLHTHFLEELLGLSKDRPCSSKTFDCFSAQKRLMEHPVIKSAFVAIRGEDTLFVDYVLRLPFFLLEQYPNVALDEEGFALPIHPFFSQKRLPSLILPEKMEWGQPCSPDALSLASSMLKCFRNKNIYIDISRAFYKTRALREIVVKIHEPFEHYLRLHPDNYKEQLANYNKLITHPTAKKVVQKEAVIDLRLGKKAYIGDK